MTIYDNGSDKKYWVTLQADWKKWGLPLAFGYASWVEYNDDDSPKGFVRDDYRSLRIQVLCLDFLVEWMVYD